MTPLQISTREHQFLAESNEIEREAIDAMPDAIEAWLRIRELELITEKDILECHRLLMRTRDLNKRYVGIYTTVQTMVGGKFNPKPFLVPNLMKDWVKQINEQISAHTSALSEDTWLVDIAKNTHIDLMKIHPFADGNGRVGRILWNWHRLQLGINVEVIYADEVGDYYEWFK